MHMLKLYDITKSKFTLYLYSVMWKLPDMTDIVRYLIHFSSASYTCRTNCQFLKLFFVGVGVVRTCNHTHNGKFIKKHVELLPQLLKDQNSLPRIVTVKNKRLKE